MHHIVSFFFSLNRTTEAIQALRKAIELDPDELASETGYATVQLASLVGGLPRRTMNNLYVRDLFNGYADRFDSELCNTLRLFFLKC